MTSSSPTSIESQYLPPASGLYQHWYLFRSGDNYPSLQNSTRSGGVWLLRNDTFSQIGSEFWNWPSWLRAGREIVQYASVVIWRVLVKQEYAWLHSHWSPIAWYGYCTTDNEGGRLNRRIVGRTKQPYSKFTTRINIEDQLRVQWMWWVNGGNRPERHNKNNNTLVNIVMRGKMKIENGKANELKKASRDDMQFEIAWVKDDEIHATVDVPIQNTKRSNGYLVRDVHHNIWQ